MPLPAIVPVLAGIAGSLGGTLLSNNANRRATERQNAYNHPSAQMARLAQAGLNPHLVYGGGVQGATGQQSSTQNVERFDPPVDFMSQLQSHVAQRRMEAEIPNIEKQQAVMDADIALKGSQTADNIARSARTRFDLVQADRLKDISAESAMQNLQNMKTSGRKMEGEINMQAVDTALKQSQIKHNEQSIKESKQRITESTDRIRTAVQNRDIRTIEKEILQLDRDLRRIGLNQSDPAWSRIMGQVLSTSGIADDTRGFLKDLGTFINPSGKSIWQRLFKW